MKLFVLTVFFLSFCSAYSEALPHETLKSFIETRVESGVIDNESETWKTRLPKFPSVEFPADGHYTWTLKTSEGTMTFKLFHEPAPEHVLNILYLSELGFYDNLNFHRIIPGFMAQGGCPLGRGNGNPGYSLKLEAKADVKHEGPGILSMARSAMPDSAGSQFFITFSSQPRLDGQYTVFGKLTEGEEVLKKLEAAGNPNPYANGVPPKKDIQILSASVEWNPPADSSK